MMHVRKLAPVPSTVSILTYHHIAAHDTAYPYDPGVADASPAQFRRQMEMLARYGTPIGIDELARALEGAPLPKNPVMVTFDDGYRSCHDVALPILRAVGMRAAFFVATGYLNERKMYWWERIALALSSARKAIAKLTYPRPLEIEARNPKSHRVLTDLIKNTPQLDVPRFLDELCAGLGVDWSPEVEAMHADNLIMSWDQVRALSRAGMDVESHTRWHRVLKTLTDAELREELAGSKAELETQLGRPVRAVAYPVGRRIAHVSRLRDAVVAAGYKLGVTNASGATRIWPTPLAGMIPTDRFDICRLSTDRSMSDAMYFMQIAVPRLAYIGRHDL
ncbi:MAG: polysaccharide deacetylase family protein [Kofleriaceae bacterium]|nr:polysaccharide deacetylase family protein [Kofleriaceae bacterium]